MHQVRFSGYQGYGTKTYPGGTSKIKGCLFTTDTKKGDTIIQVSKERRKKKRKKRKRESNFI